MQLNYVLVGKTLQELRKHCTIFWTLCIACCLDLILEDIGKLDWVNRVADQAKSVTKFIYNHTWFYLMRKNTRSKELCSAGYYFATNFLTLQSHIA
jgi:hypothetical protein